MVETVRDARLILQATNERWAISPEVRQLAIEQLYKLLKSSRNRDKIAAAKALMAADLINAKRESTEQRGQNDTGRRRIELLAIAQRFGVDSRIGIATDERTIGNTQVVIGSGEAESIIGTA